MLIYAHASGAVDNSACRDFSGMDPLTASSVLRRLRDSHNPVCLKCLYLLTGTDILK